MFSQILSACVVAAGATGVEAREVRRTNAPQTLDSAVYQSFSLRLIMLDFANIFDNACHHTVYQSTKGA